MNKTPEPRLFLSSVGNHGSIVNLQDYQSAGKAIQAIANGELIYDPSRIRVRVVELCGLAAFRKPLSDMYDSTIQSKSR